MGRRTPSQRNNPPMMLHHITMHVSNLAHTIELLDAFGFTCVVRDAHEAWVQAPNAYLHLCHDHTITPNDHNFTDAGISHICIQTPDMRQALRTLRAHGARPLSQPINLGTGHWYLYVRLPDGDIIEIEGVPYAPTDATPWLAHVALVSTDLPRISTFYQQLTATTLRNGQRIGPNPRFDTGMQLHDVQMIPAWVVGANLTIECWQFFQPQTHAIPHTPYAYRAIGLVVADVATACHTAVTLGAERIAESPHAATLRDPDGNTLTLTHPTALPPALTTYADATIIARINSAWRPLDATIRWEDVS